MQKLKRRKALRVPLLKIKNACASSLPRRILSLLSLNCYTCIAGADAKQAKNSTHNSRQHYFSKHHQNSVYGGLHLLQVYGDVNRTGISLEVFQSPFCFRELAFHVKDFLPTVFQHSIGSHSFFLPVGSLFQVDKHY